MSEKFCSVCGKANSAEMSFCLNCGNSLASSGSSSNFSQESAPTVFITPKVTDGNFQPLTPNRPPTPQPPKKSSKGLWLALLGGGGLIGLLIFIGIIGLVALNWDSITGKGGNTNKLPPPTPAISPSPVQNNTPVALHSPPPTPFTSGTPTGSTPSATFNRAWVDYNITENGRKGMRIHAKFTAYKMKGLDSHMAVYFSYRNGDRLTTTNKSFASTEGQVAVFRALKPAYDPAEFADLTVFIPYDELNLGKGKFALRMDIDVIYDKGGLIQHLTFYDFDYSF